MQLGCRPVAVVIMHIHKYEITMALGSTQPVTEMSTRSIFWV